ncbi:MAG: hypothetical protein LBL56_03875 [Treponema sp.]|jgi:hypothetical protein|nr:hypothetical protein [Treponema sp.]
MNSFARGRGYRLPGGVFGLFLVLALAACPTVLDNPAGPAAPGDPAGASSPGDNWQQGIMQEATARNIFDYSPCAGGIRIDRLRSVPALASYLAGGTAPDPAQGDRTFTIKTIAGKQVAEIAGGAFAAAPENDISSLVRIIVLPDTITSLGTDLFAGIESPVIVNIPASVVSALGATALSLAAGNEGNAKIQSPSSPSGSGTPPPVVIVHPRPALRESAVNYDPATGAVSVRLAFDMAVTVESGGDWTIAGNESQTITAAPVNPAPGAQVQLVLAAANPDDTTRITAVRVECMPVDGVWERPLSGGGYTLLYYDTNGAVGLEDSGGSPHWYYVPEGAEKKLFNTINSPNALVPGLFKIWFGTDSSGDRVEIGGTALPGPAGGITVLDIGLPDTNNDGLPVFFIPPGALGAEGQDYAHIRLRVNRGASLVILADNTAYEADGAGHPCPYGNLTGAAVEVMGGGRLRVGAYEGYPLGTGTAIIARLGSWLATGPESSFSSQTAGYVHERDRWFEGWLIGPVSSGARIVWDVGDQNGSYIEIREGKIAFDVNLTVRKSLALMHSVWFVNGPCLTIDAAGDDLTLGSGKGLFTAAPEFKFHGTKSGSGGQNPSHESAKIVIKRGSAVSRSFLSGNTEDEDMFVAAEDGDITIRNQGKTGATLQSYNDKVYGYLNWGF